MDTVQFMWPSPTAFTFSCAVLDLRRDLAACPICLGGHEMLHARHRSAHRSRLYSADPWAPNFQRQSSRGCRKWNGGCRPSLRVRSVGFRPVEFGLFVVDRLIVLAIGQVNENISSPVKRRSRMWLAASDSPVGSSQTIHSY